MTYVRPLLGPQDALGQDAVPLAGGWLKFERCEILERGRAPERVLAAELDSQTLERLTAPRSDIGPLPMNVPQVMGILNVTPDSFSDGGDAFETQDAIVRANTMLGEGATIIDVGGESTRPGAKEVPVTEEIARVMPVIDGLTAPLISVDTRKSQVVEALPANKPFLVNDVSAMRFDPDMAQTVANAGLPICLMHSVADPETMQSDPRYDNVLLDVYDHLSDRIDAALSAGIPREKIIVDPGIGFGKTLDHNLTLLRGLSLFHALGCPVLLGASRKRFIGTIGKAEIAKDRLGGSVSVALHGVMQGVQILRVHDTFATKQAIDLHMAITGHS